MSQVRRRCPRQQRTKVSEQVVDCASSVGLELGETQACGGCCGALDADGLNRAHVAHQRDLLKAVSRSRVVPIAVRPAVCRALLTVAAAIVDVYGPSLFPCWNPLCPVCLFKRLQDFRYSVDSNRVDKRERSNSPNQTFESGEGACAPTTIRDPPWSGSMPGPCIDTDVMEEEDMKETQQQRQLRI